MKPKKVPKPNKKDIQRQQEIEKRTEAEKVKLDHPNGKERFEQAIKRMGKRQK